MIIDKNDAGKLLIRLTDEDVDTIKEHLYNLNFSKEEGVVGIDIRKITMMYSLLLKTENHIFTNVPEDEEFKLINGRIIIEDEPK